MIIKKIPEVLNFRDFLLLSIDENKLKLYFRTVQLLIKLYTFGYFSLR